MTPPAFAKLHGVTVKAVYNWIKAGKVRYQTSSVGARTHYWITQTERPEALITVAFTSEQFAALARLIGGRDSPDASIVRDAIERNQG